MATSKQPYYVGDIVEIKNVGIAEIVKVERFKWNDMDEAWDVHIRLLRFGGDGLCGILQVGTVVCYTLKDETEYSNYWKVVTPSFDRLWHG